MSVASSERCVWLRYLCTNVCNTPSRSSKVFVLGLNTKGIGDFLLVINRNLGPISHRFRDMASYWLKIAKFLYPLSFRALVLGNPCTQRHEIWSEETRDSTLSYGKNTKSLSHLGLVRYRDVTDRRTDRNTIANTCLAHGASRVKKLNKYFHPRLHSPYRFDRLQPEAQ